MTTTTAITINDRLVELGVLGDQKDKAIQQTGARIVKHFFKNYEADTYTPGDEATALLLHYLTDIQVRDYAMGILDVYDTQHTLDALNFLLDQAPTDTAYINAPACLLATFLYERGDSASAVITLTNVSGYYSLALLLGRVMSAGLAPSFFSKMRTEIHPKVVAGIFDEEDDSDVYTIPQPGDPEDAGIDRD
jgi:hypothetical protein